MVAHRVVVGKPHLGAYRYHQHFGHKLLFLLRHLQRRQGAHLATRLCRLQKHHGIDHGFAVPLRDFEVHQLKPDWPTFLEDFQRHWPTDAEHTYVDFVRDGLAGNGAARAGNTRWRRMTEQRAGSAKSVFHFDVQGSGATATPAGLPSCFAPLRSGGGRPPVVEAPEPPPVVETPPVAERPAVVASVMIVSDPPGAEVLLNGSVMGTTPLAVPRPSGSEIAGWISRSRSVSSSGPGGSA